eukprot:46860-Eustigmatos_ZCMA.PRE.2
MATRSSAARRRMMQAWLSAMRAERHMCFGATDVDLYTSEISIQRTWNENVGSSPASSLRAAGRDVHVRRPVMTLSSGAAKWMSSSRSSSRAWPISLPRHLNFLSTSSDGAAAVAPGKRPRLPPAAARHIPCCGFCSS